MGRRAIRPGTAAWLPFAVGAGGLVLLFAAQATIGRGMVEDRLTSASEKALQSQRLAGVRVTFTGRDADVVVAGSPQEAAQARSVVEKVSGVRVVAAGVAGPAAAAAGPGTPAVPGANRPGPEPPAQAAPIPSEPSAVEMPGGVVPGSSAQPGQPEPTQPEPTESAAPAAPAGPAGPLPIGLTFKDGTVTVTGTVPDDDARSALIDAVKEQDDWPVTDRLTLDNTLNQPDPDWISAIGDFAKAIPSGEPLLVARWDDGSVIVRGTPASAREERDILDAAGRTVDDSADVTDGLDVR